MRQSQRAFGLSHVYATAEGEVMAHLVDSLEGLLAISRTLFGTSEWLTEESDPAASETAPHDRSRDEP